MPRTSAGLLMHRVRGGRPEVLLVHPGGPFWRNKDEGAWSIPKGEPADTQGSLGAWAAAAKSPPGLFPQGSDGASAIQHLRDGELHNFEDYCVASASLDAGSRQLLQNLLIPTQRRHVRVLNELLGD